MRRGLLLLAIVVLVVLGVWRPWQADPRLRTDLRRDLLLDPQHVELLEGFEPGTRLVVWPDHPRENLDREQVAVVPFPRNGRMLWHVGARPGRFSARAARLQLGQAGDASSCRVTVAIVGGSATDSVTVEVPVVGPDLEAAPERLREGPEKAFSLALPTGAETLEIRIDSSGPVPPGSFVTLLSPRVVHEQPLLVPAADLPLEFDEEQRLTALWEPSEDGPLVPFADAVSREEGVEPVAYVEELPPVEVTGAFSARTGRHALAFTGEARFEATVDLEADSRLEGSLALDIRMPPGTRAEFVLTVDGEEVGRSEVSSALWHEVSWPLGAHAGRGRRLGLAVRELALDPRPVARPVPDYARGVEVPTDFTARLVRVGFGDPRLVRPRAVLRRVASRRHPSVILVQIETLRADVLGPWGGDAALTPNLSRLAQRAVVYEHALAASPWTLPTTASLFTGLPPSAHGVVDHDRAVLPDGAATLAERARAAGVMTGGFVTNTLLRDDAGYGRGFEVYGELPYRNARQVNAFAEGFLENHAGQQLLLYLHYFEPHSPSDAPGFLRDRYVDPDLRDHTVEGAEASIIDRIRVGTPVPEHDPDVRFLFQRYLGEVAYMDALLGELCAAVDRLGLAPTTALVVTADHGEEFLEHGLLGHSANLHVETVQVPLLVAPPGALVGWAAGSPPPPGTGRRERGVVETAGLYSEVLRMLDAPFPEDEQRLDGLAPREFAFVETDRGLALDGKGDPFRRPLRAVRSASHMLVWRRPVEGEEGEGTFCLYDLVADPQERNPLEPVGREADWLRAQLDESLRWVADHALEAPGQGGDAARLEALRQLGYLEGGPGGARLDGGCSR